MLKLALGQPWPPSYSYFMKSFLINKAKSAPEGQKSIDT
jgi:hypothetical protein